MTQDICLITEVEEGSLAASDARGNCDERRPCTGSTQSTNPDPPPSNGPAQFPILCQDVQLKDKRWVELLRTPLAPQPKPRKVSLRNYLECSSAPTTPATATDALTGNDEIPDLSVSAPSLDWEQMVDQLNQDPCADSVMDLAPEAISMGEGRANIAGDEEVECRDDGPTAQVTTSPGLGPL